MQRIAYLGPPGTYTGQAARRYQEMSGEPARLLDFPTFPEVLEALLDGQADLAVLPIENSIEGSVLATLDLLAAHREITICQELVLAIRHHLLVKEGGLEDIEEILSHGQALAQCRETLRKHFPKARTRLTDSTAEAARMVAGGGKGLAAVGSQWAAGEYGLKILLRNIQDRETNKTRFVVLGKETPRPTGRDKTSLVFSLPQDKPGGLFEALRVFAERAVNLTKIESRPSKKELGDYLFFVDLEGHGEEPLIAEALQELKGKTAYLAVLGSYPMEPGGEEP